jgi:hypothetical protein
MATTQKTTLSLNSGNGKGRKLPDPILDKYDEQGILGSTPGKVKKNGKELTVEEAKLAEKKDAEEKRKAAEDEIRREQRDKELVVISEARSVFKDSINMTTRELKISGSITALTLATFGASIFTGILSAPDTNLRLFSFLALFGSGVVMTLGISDGLASLINEAEESSLSRQVICIKNLRALKPGLRVFEALEKGVEPDLKDVKKATYNGSFMHYVRKLADEAGSEPAKRLELIVDGVPDR